MSIGLRGHSACLTFGNSAFLGGTKDQWALYSAPEAIQRFTLSKEDAIVSTETPLLRVSATGWKDFLGKFKSEIVQFLAQRLDFTPQEAEARIDAALENLKPFDRLEVLAKSKANQGTLVIRVTMGRKN